MSDTKQFDLHIEVGEHSSGLMYAQTVVSSKIVSSSKKVLMRQEGKTASEAVQKLISYYPFDAGPVIPTKIDPKAPKIRFSDLGHVERPDCKLQCITWDNFKDEARCKRMCPTRKF